MARRNILALLQGGDRRSIGRADEVAAIVSKDLTLFPELIDGLESEDRLVRMRAADAAEKVTRGNHELLQPFKTQLLGWLAETNEQELRWHLAAMIPRLALNSRERQLVVASLHIYLEDRSSIVKTFALEALAGLARDEPGLQGDVIEVLREATRTGTPAMKARSRKLLLQLHARDASK